MSYFRGPLLSFKGPDFLILLMGLNNNITVASKFAGPAGPPSVNFDGPQAILRAIGQRAHHILTPVLKPGILAYEIKSFAIHFTSTLFLVFCLHKIVVCRKLYMKYKLSYISILQYKKIWNVEDLYHWLATFLPLWVFCLHKIVVCSVEHYRLSTSSHISILQYMKCWRSISLVGNLFTTVD